MRLTLALVLALTSQAATAQTTVDDAALADETQGANWLGFGRTYSEQRFSPLTQINADNVAQLGLDWFIDLPGERSLLSTPLVVDGIMYFTGSYSRTYAVDTRSRKILWTFDPQVLKVAGDRSRVFWDSNRGAAYWKGHVFVATGDGRLIAINAQTGEQVWSTQTTDVSKPVYINGAPKVFRDKVLIGNGGTEVGASRGYVTAYDAATGEQAWRFFIVPGNPADGFEDEAQAMAAKTWTGEWWKHGGGGNSWHAWTYDPEFNRIYIGTGNGSPWNRKLRSPDGGDNLFLCAIVALDADTGKYVWHYQTTPGETWDYNSNMDIVLSDLTIDDKKVKALIHAPKNGFFYVIDRATGKLISAEKIGKVTWASHVDLATGRPVEIPGARYEDGEELIYPSPFGVHNWHAMSFNPQTGLAYLPTLELPMLFTDKGYTPGWQSPNFEIDPGVRYIAGDEVETKLDAAWLLAWDPATQKEGWKVALPGVWNPGTMTTAGSLVFQGRADGKFVAYRAQNGDALWTFDTKVGISAPPVTYEVDGKQYVSLLVGWGGGGASVAGSVTAQHGWTYGVHPRRLLTFALDGKVALPETPSPQLAKSIVNADFKLDAQQADSGNTLFSRRCAVCHGAGAVAGGYAPDLRASPISLYLDALRDVVVEGSRRERGMPGFQELTDQDLIALQHYIQRQARSGATSPLQQAAQPAQR